KIGAEGFEPPTLWSQTRCATRLRYAPIALIIPYALARECRTRPATDAVEHGEHAAQPEIGEAIPRGESGPCDPEAAKYSKRCSPAGRRCGSASLLAAGASEYEP